MATLSVLIEVIKKGSGAEELSRQLDNLSDKVLSVSDDFLQLDKILEDLEDTAKKTDTSIDKLGDALQEADKDAEALDGESDELTVSLQKLNEAAVKATTSLDKLGDKAGKGGDGVKRTGDESVKAKSQLDQLAGGLDAAEKAAIAFGTAVVVVKETIDFAEQGAQISLVEDRFDRLSESINESADSLESRLVEATKRQVAEADLLASANQLIELGLASTGDEVVQLSRLVTGLNLDLQVLGLTLANDSRLRLDSLGLSLEAVNERTREFVKQGIAASEAFDLAVIEALEERFALIGDAADTSVGAWGRLRTEVANTTNDFKQFLDEGLSPIVAGFFRLQDAINEVGQDTQNIGGVYENASKGILAFTTADERARDSLIETAAQTAATSQSFEEFERNLAKSGITIELLERALVNNIATLNTTTAEFFQQSRAASQLSAADSILIRNTRQLNDVIDEQSGQLSVNEDLLRSVNRIILDYGGSLGATSRELEEAAFASGELEGASERLEEIIQQRRQSEADQQAAIAATREETQKLVDILNSREVPLFNQRLDQIGQQFVTVGGRTQAQNEALSLLTDELESVNSKLFEYEIGLAGAGLSSDELAEKQAELGEEAARLQGLIEPLAAVTGELQAVNVEATVNTQAVNDSLFEQAQQAGATSEQLLALKVAYGEITPEQAAFIVQSQILNEELGQLAEAFTNADGQISAEQISQAAQDLAEGNVASAEAALEAIQNENDLRDARERARDAAFEEEEAITAQKDALILANEEAVNAKDPIEELAGAFGIARDEARDAASETENFNEQISKIPDEQTKKVTFLIETIGQIPSGFSGGGDGQPAPDVPNIPQGLGVAQLPGGTTAAGFGVQPQTTTSTPLIGQVIVNAAPGMDVDQVAKATVDRINSSLGARVRRNRNAGIAR